MDIELFHHGSVPVFRLKGRLSITGADDFEKRVVEAIDAGASQILFSLGELDYISSAGLRVFYVAIKKLNNDARRLSFCIQSRP